MDSFEVGPVLGSGQFWVRPVLGSGQFWGWASFGWTSFDSSQFWVGPVFTSQFWVGQLCLGQFWDVIVKECNANHQSLVLDFHEIK